MTDMNGHVPPDILNMWIQGSALRKAGQPVDIAQAILWFLADELYVTGQTIVVDGGVTMH